MPKLRTPALTPKPTLVWAAIGLNIVANASYSNGNLACEMAWWFAKSSVQYWIHGLLRFVGSGQFAKEKLYLKTELLPASTSMLMPMTSALMPTHTPIPELMLTPTLTLMLMPMLMNPAPTPELVPPTSVPMLLPHLRRWLFEVSQKR